MLPTRTLVPRRRRGCSLPASSPLPPPCCPCSSLRRDRKTGTAFLANTKCARMHDPGPKRSFTYQGSRQGHKGHRPGVYRLVPPQAPSPMQSEGMPTHPSVDGAPWVYALGPDVALAPGGPLRTYLYSSPACCSICVCVHPAITRDPPVRLFTHTTPTFPSQLFAPSFFSPNSHLFFSVTSHHHTTTS